MLPCTTPRAPSQRDHNVAFSVDAAKERVCGASEMVPPLTTQRLPAASDAPHSTPTMLSVKFWKGNFSISVFY